MSNLENYMKQQAIFCEQNDSISKNLYSEYVGKKFLPVTAAASSNANTNVSMMGKTFKYCAPIAGALGFSAEDS